MAPFPQRPRAAESRRATRCRPSRSSGRTSPGKCAPHSLRATHQGRATFDPVARLASSLAPNRKNQPGDLGVRVTEKWTRPGRPGISRRVTNSADGTRRRIPMHALFRSVFLVVVTMVFLLLGADPATTRAKTDFTYFAEAFSFASTDA